jgi:hypothetical protein
MSTFTPDQITVKLYEFDDTVREAIAAGTIAEMMREKAVELVSVQLDMNAIRADKPC